MNQINLFNDEGHQCEPKTPPKAPDKSNRISGIIARQIDQLKANDDFNWIQRTVKLKFQRQVVSHGNI